MRRAGALIIRSGDPCLIPIPIPPPSARLTRAGLAAVDPVWSHIQAEAEEIVEREPALSGFVLRSILHHDTLEEAVVHRIAARLDHSVVPADLIVQVYRSVLRNDATIGQAFRADIMAVADRDPACTRFLDPVLYFKGFHALQAHRLAHALWDAGRKDFALYVQSRSSEVFQTDIHPAAKLGRGLFLDHATGIVVGETAVIEDDVSMLARGHPGRHRQGK